MAKTPQRTGTGGRRGRGSQRRTDADVAYAVPVDPAAPIDNTQSHDVAQPIFGQPVASVDPTEFLVKHASDTQAYMSGCETSLASATMRRALRSTRGSGGLKAGLARAGLASRRWRRTIVGENPFSTR